MTSFSKGGVIEGPPQTVRFVAECSPDGKGRIDVVFADECIVGRDRNCTRTDTLHAAVPGAVKNRSDRWFICPMHDGGSYPPVMIPQRGYLDALQDVFYTARYPLAAIILVMWVVVIASVLT